MNPLTKRATHNVNRATHNVNRENNLIAWGSGVVFATLVIAFFL